MHYIPFDGQVRVIFVFQVASFWPSWESLYRECLADSRFRVKLLWIDDPTGDEAQMSTAQSFLEGRQIPYERFDDTAVQAFRPHYMVYQTPYDKGHRGVSFWTSRYQRQGARIVYIPYGIEISDTEESRYKHFTLPTVLNAFRIYVMSRAMQEEYRKHCTNARAVRATGLPRFDPLLHKGAFPLADELRKNVRGRRVILWKSHFPKVFMSGGRKLQATPDLREYLRFVLYIQLNPELFFIFMPHPKYTDATIDPELRAMAQQLLDELAVCGNVYIDRADDYRHSLVHADAMIVDRSAVMVEAGVLGIPVLYMRNADYEEPMTPPVRALLDSYAQGSRAVDMVRFCDDARWGMDNRQEERESAVRKAFDALDGKNGWRIKEDLWASAQEDAEAGIVDALDASARVILFGLGAISRYCAKQLEGYQGVKVIAYADNDSAKHGTAPDGLPVIAPDAIAQWDYDYIVIATERYFFPVFHQLADALGVDPRRILNYDQYITLCRALPFAGFALGQKAGQFFSALHAVYHLLEDEESREVYRLRLQFLMTNRYRYIEEIVEQYVPDLPVKRDGGMDAVCRKLSGERGIILYGAGDEAEKIIHRLARMENLSCVCDRNPGKQEKGFHGLCVRSPESMLEHYAGEWILVSTVRYADEVEDFLLGHQVPPENIVQLGDYLYRGAGNLYFGMDFLHFYAQEVLVDAGCGTLLATRRFLARCPEAKKVLAFEPDPSNFQKCVKAKAKEKEKFAKIELFPCGTWSERKIMPFRAEGTGLSRLSEDGSARVEVMPIDEAVGDERVTFIKMDVMGAELESLKGARQTIIAHRPKLAISLYHRPEDMLALPLYLKSLVPDYRLYVRHHSNTSAKTVLYAVC